MSIDKCSMSLDGLVDSSSTMMDISADLNEFFAPDWTDIEISPFSATELIPIGPSITQDLEDLEGDESKVEKPCVVASTGLPRNFQSESFPSAPLTGVDEDEGLMMMVLDDVRTMDDDQEVCGLTGGDVKATSNILDEVIRSMTPPPALVMTDYKCELCSKRFRYRSKYNDHMVIHTGLKPFRCSLCDRAFALKHHLRDHARTHRRDKPFQCEVCCKRFTEKNYFTLHVLKHRLGKEWKCPICPKSFFHKSLLDCHLGKHTEHSWNKSALDIGTIREKTNGRRSPKLPKDKECSSTIDSGSTGISSSGKVLSKDKPFGCNVCTKSFRTEGQLGKHLVIHSKPISCPICQAAYASGEDLSEHMKSTHSAPKPFRCDACSKCFRRRNQLTKHILDHSGKAQFKCEDCGKRFADPTTWKRHRQTHAGEPQHKCEICSKSFILLSNLKEHLLIHSGIKGFQCPICDKSFTRKGDLKKHNQSHLVDKPHLCEFCGKGFSRQYNLKLHYKNHHPSQVSLHT